MAATTVTNYSSTIQTKWEKQLLKTAEGYLLADQDANTRMMGKGEGNTVRINRILRPSIVTSAATSGTLITASSAKNLTSNYIDFTMENWGDSFGFNEDVDVQSFISDKENQDVIANQMARSLDYQVMKKIATQCFRHRADADGTYEKSGTVDSATASTVVDNALNQADDYWNGGYITITNAAGPGYDESHVITDFTQSGSVVATAFTNTPTSSSKYHITSATNLAATDIITTTNLLYTSALHEKMETEKFAGGTYHAMISPEQHNDLWSDTTFLNSAIYDSSERLSSYQLVRWFDIVFKISSNIYREEASTGAEIAPGSDGTVPIHVAPIYGKNSYTVIRYGNPGGSGKFAVKFYVVDTPDSGNLRNSAKYLSWKGMWAGGVTRATSVIGLMTGVTNLIVSV